MQSNTNDKASREGWPCGEGRDGAYFFGVGAPVADGPGVATLGLDGAISAAFGRTLGGLAAVAVGECAPAASSGFCAAGVAAGAA